LNLDLSIYLGSGRGPYGTGGRRLMVYSYDRAVRSLKDPGSMKPPMKEEPDFEDLVTDHHSYAASVAGYRRRLSGPGAFDAGNVSGFIDAMGIAGLAPGRQVFYVTRLHRILSAVRATGAGSVAALDADGCKAVLTGLVSEKYSGETKLAYELCLKKLVHYAKTGNLGGAGAAGYILRSRFSSCLAYELVRHFHAYTLAKMTWT